MSYGKIGIIGAMQEEIELLVRDMSCTSRRTEAGIDFIEGEFCGKRVAVCKSGVGKVNAAVTTQLLILACQAEAVVFTGVAGALDPALEVGDLVVSADCMQHDVDAAALGFPRGIIPYQETSVFVADPKLRQVAYEAGQRLFPGRVRLGRVLSGDQFIADKTLGTSLHQELSGACAEMEGAAVAQVCVMNGIPFVVIRAMSDKADGSADVSFAEFTELASRKSHQLVEAMLTAL
ncbi:MAG: nucleosidase [Paenibacillaceae bacterium]|jgi:adenosylhomocysteine nucleosidase|nr:nucleosidase [Paenibacillaceae bacterium]